MHDNLSERNSKVILTVLIIKIRTKTVITIIMTSS